MQCIIASDAALESLRPSRWGCKTGNNYGLVGLHCLVRPYGVGVRSMSLGVEPSFENQLCHFLVGTLGRMI